MVEVATSVNQAPATLRVGRGVLIFIFVFVSGFFNLATQIIGPRMFASFFGTDTTVWAVMISVTLVGLAFGYFFGGRIPLQPAKRYLPGLLLGNALYLIALSFLVWQIPADLGAWGVPAILGITFVTFFIPSLLFGTVSPLSITLFSELVPRQQMARVTGGIYGVGTLGNVLGALSAAFFFIPYVGLSASLQLFAAVLLIFALVFALSVNWSARADAAADQQATPSGGEDGRIQWDVTTLVLLLLIFFSGFASLATEIIAPRMFTSLYGPTTILWAIVISVTLLGLSIGYIIGGNIPLRFARTALPLVITLNAVLLLLASWIVWELPAELGPVDVETVIITALAAFLPPSILFGIDSQIVIAWLAEGRSKRAVSRMVGLVFGITTIGSFVGALMADIVLLPTIGFSLSLQLFALGFFLFALYLYPGVWRVLAVAGLIFFVAWPQPDWRWDEPGLTLLAQQEGHYQTVRIYTDERTFIRMHLGPTYESEMDINTLEPGFGYARNMVEATGDVQGKDILVIGGAGHSMARELEERGATVTEVEIDPVVVALSDEFFGPIEGDVIVDDGRAYVERAASEQFDFVLIDAFNGPQSIPAQLTTVEFFEAIERVLKPEGVMVMNFIGSTTGDRSGSFEAIAATVSAAFNEARFFGRSGNILLFGSPGELTQYRNLPILPTGGQVLTDDLNPIEILLEEARGSGFRYRR